MSSLVPELVDLLVCPVDHRPLDYLAGESVLYNQRNRHRYAVDGGIPVLLVSEAVAVDDDEHARLTKLINEGQGRTTGAAVNEGEGK